MTSTTPNTTETPTITTPEYSSTVSALIWAPTPTGAFVQLGFEAILNWTFVVMSVPSQEKIFSLIPRAIAYAIDENESHITSQYLQPYDSRSAFGYITTLTVLAIPAAKVDKLNIALLNESSGLYTHPDTMVRQIAQFLDSSIPLQVQESSNVTVPAPKSRATNSPPAGLLPAVFVFVVVFIVSMVGYLFWRRHRKRKTRQEQGPRRHSDTHEAGTEYIDKRAELPGNRVQQEMETAANRHELKSSGKQEMETTANVHELEP